MEEGRAAGQARGRGTWLLRAGLGGIVLLALGSRAEAYFLDANRDYELRARLYNETAISAEDSQPQTKPARATGQVIEQRTFFNPEFEAKFTRHQSLLDDLSFRMALWGFYDGLYEYETSQYERSAFSLKGILSQGHTETAQRTRTAQRIDPTKTYTYQPDPVLGSYGDPGDVSTVPFRINETYVNLVKGPLFVRIGRQAISWGESDTIALLDANNPFNQTSAIAGIFQDIDEARIPLWTMRMNYDLFRSWGPISSAYAEGYLVPGSIDTTISYLPLPKSSPYSPPQDDPQALINGLVPPSIQGPIVNGALGGIQLAVYDRLPSRSMANSRFGFRLGGIIARDYTTSIWYYRTFANPVPVFQPLDVTRAPIANPKGKGPTQLITELHNGLVDVAGGATSFFSEPLNGIIRAEGEFFIGEPGFIPNQNIPFEAELRNPAIRKLLAGLGQTVSQGIDHGTVPHANFLRFELGYDRFFFFRPLNRSNSFTWVTAYIGQWNLTETFTDKNFRFNGQQKTSPTGTRIGANAQDLTLQTISKLHTVATDFVDLYPYESFVQTHLQTDYLHGRLTPAVTAVIGLNGTFAVPVELTYRYTDWLLFNLKYAYLGGAFMWPTGFFRDRSQISARVTWLLN
jgi:hypothetical protein